MNAMKISLTMNEDKSIIIKNVSNNKSFKIDYENKTITAIDIYNILAYEPGVIYEIESNLDIVTDENDKTYFLDIINLIKSITKEVNEMSKDNNAENIEIDEEIEHSEYEEENKVLVGVGE